jgi:hypothetical protein
MDKRHFTVVIGSKEHGLYISSKPSSAAKKAVSKLCAANKSKKVEFCLREITQGSKKKTYGPYVGEMKKLKKPIELKGRVIRHEIKLHLKKEKHSTTKPAKKMRGGENGSSAPMGEENEPTISLNTEIQEFNTFISKHFPINNGSIKIDILQRIRSMSRQNPESKKSKQYFFYVYRTNPKPNKIISVGVIPQQDTEIRNYIKLNDNYLFIGALLSRQSGNRGGTSAIYHILSKLPPIFSGICLSTTSNAFGYYTKLGFTIIESEDNMMKLNKTDQNMALLKRIIEKHGPITTEFYSNCPYLNYTEEELQSIRGKIKRYENLRYTRRRPLSNKEKELNSIREKIRLLELRNVSNNPLIFPIQRNSVGMPQKLNQYWNPDKQKWVSPKYSRIKTPSRNEIARELLRKKMIKIARELLHNKMMKSKE